MRNDEPSPPVVRVVRGTATAEELAALTVVLMARAAAVRGAGARPVRHLRVARWRRPERTLGSEGPRGWPGRAYEPVA